MDHRVDPGRGGDVARQAGGQGRVEDRNVGGDGTRVDRKLGPAVDRDH